MLMDRFFFIPAKYERLKKWNVLYTSVLSLFMNPVVCSFWSIGRKLETDIDASFIADIFFSSMHKMTILDSINIKIEEKLSRIWAYSIEILHHKFYNQSILYFSIDNCSNINPSRRSDDDMLILHFQEQAFIYWNITISGWTSLYFPILNNNITLKIVMGSSSLESLYFELLSAQFQEMNKLPSISPPTIEWRQFWIVHPFVFRFLFTMSSGRIAWKFVTTLFFPRSRSVDKASRVKFIFTPCWPNTRCFARRGTRCLRKRNWNLQMRTTCSRNEKDDYKSASLFVFERVNRGDETLNRHACLYTRLLLFQIQREFAC